MRSLRELQAGVASALLGGSAAAVAPWIRGGRERAEAGLAVYRRNLRATTLETLRAVYPVVERLVGQGFFRTAAASYLRERPSPGGDLNDYGRAFPGFLRAYGPAADLPYLADVARLEWFVEESFQAADHDALDLARIAALSPDGFAALRVRVHPAVRLLSSPYPVDRIWEVNQPSWDAEPAVDLARGGCRVLVRRPFEQVIVEPLEAGESALLGLLASGLPLGRALDLAQARAGGVDVGAFLRRRVSDLTLVDMEVPARERKTRKS